MNLTEMSTLEAAVAKGAAYLDGRYPGWRWRVQPDTIEAGCMLHSVTGQLFGEQLVDQLRGVGFSPELAILEETATARIMGEFAAMGFAVMSMDAYFPSDVARAEALVDGITLPSILPVPRDQDIVLMEVESLTVLWEREVSKR